MIYERGDKIGEGMAMPQMTNATGWVLKDERGDDGEGEGA